MSVGAVDADARVEVQLAAALAARLRLDLAHYGVRVAPPAQRAAGDEVVDVEEAAPREALADAETRDRGGLLVARLELRDESVARRTLGLDAVDERRRRAEVWAELERAEGLGATRRPAARGPRARPRS